jgi:hypothetical protein
LPGGPARPRASPGATTPSIRARNWLTAGACELHGLRSPSKNLRALACRAFDQVTTWGCRQHAAGPASGEHDRRRPSRGPPTRVLLAQGSRKPAATSTSVSRWTRRSSQARQLLCSDAALPRGVTIQASCVATAPASTAVASQGSGSATSHLLLVPSSSDAGHELDASSLGIAEETLLAGIMLIQSPASVPPSAVHASEGEVVNLRHAGNITASPTRCRSSRMEASRDSAVVRPSPH